MMLSGFAKPGLPLGLMSVEDYQRAIDYEPARGITLPAGRDLSQGELVALVEACKTAANAAEALGKKPDIAWRDAAIIGILYTCGLRRSELVALQMADYDAETGRLNILHGKGNKQRTVFVKNGTSKALAMWLACRGTAPGAIFNPINKSGRIEPKAMTDQAVYNMLKKRGEQAKLKDFSPHDFRRTFVGDLLDRGVGIDTVASLAGHASVDTTRRYDRRPERVKEDAVNKLHFPF